MSLRPAASRLPPSSADITTPSTTIPTRKLPVPLIATTGSLRRRRRRHLTSALSASQWRLRWQPLHPFTEHHDDNSLANCPRRSPPSPAVSDDALSPSFRPLLYAAPQPPRPFPLRALQPAPFTREPRAPDAPPFLRVAYSSRKEPAVEMGCGGIIMEYGAYLLHLRRAPHDIPSPLPPPSSPAFPRAVSSPPTLALPLHALLSQSSMVRGSSLDASTACSSRHVRRRPDRRCFPSPTLHPPSYSPCVFY
ncbi:hypothetical protein B0H16DRAFT_1898763 [Mycena metata]|uniref:Uncharacterized protein n=1 Tax=Mycena metata TaxID=1033252 RepID=A0AAD7H8Z4_9AGAR|nr:hypothetical protein B0H16DRAFT_1898763 [Mycena metata]